MNAVTWSLFIGLCSLGLSIVFGYVAYFAGNDAYQKAGRPTWPLHGRWVIFGMLSLLAGTFFNSFRLWLKEGNIDPGWYFGLGLESTSLLRGLLLAAVWWFTKRWRAGTLLTLPKASAR